MCWTNVFERIFDFGPWLIFVVQANTILWGGQKNLKIDQIFIHRPPWNQFLRTICDIQLFYRTIGCGHTASTLPPNGPFTRNASPLWSLVLMGSVIPFGKALHKISKCVRVDFWNGLVFPRLPKETSLGCPEVGLYDNFSILGYKRDPCWNVLTWQIYFCNFLLSCLVP